MTLIRRWLGHIWERQAARREIAAAEAALTAAEAALEAWWLVPDFPATERVREARKADVAAATVRVHEAHGGADRLRDPRAGTGGRVTWLGRLWDRLTLSPEPLKESERRWREHRAAHATELTRELRRLRAIASQPVPARARARDQLPAREVRDVGPHGAPRGPDLRYDARPEGDPYSSILAARRQTVEPPLRLRRPDGSIVLVSQVEAQRLLDAGVIEWVPGI